MSETPRYPFLHVRTTEDESDDLAVELFDLGASGVETRDDETLSKATAGVLLVASFEDEETARAALEALGEDRATLVFVEGDDWRDEWKRFFKPSRIGERFVVRPSWEPFDAGPDDLVIVIDPGRAFGTGLHETTRLVIRELEQRVTPGVEVLDVGTGSGILSIAALMLGAGRALGIDVDEDAVEIAVENAAINGLADRFEGSATPVDAIEARYPLVLANIEARVLIPLAAAIGARVAPGGVLILSGLLAGQEDEVQGHYVGFERLALTREGDWVALTLVRAPG
ncbi:MAG: 50S ribosomal protein L11 methyltransferase [Myxococcales bacterium]|nr:50S ribosomal protein L11 methyltransferase [Myxococcales bacterium]